MGKYNYQWPGFPSATPKEVILDKGKAAGVYLNYMLNRTQSIFKYTGLPDTIPADMLELYLQTNGNVIIAKDPTSGDLYAFTGGFGGEPDAYYRPTIYTVSNPGLNLSKMYKIGKDCVLIKSDTMLMGLVPLFGRFASQLVDIDISMWRSSINSRAMTLISGGTDPVKKAADKFIEDLEAGKLSAVGDSSFMEALKTHPINGSSSQGYITQLIELRQYWIGNWYQELGLNSNYNMKRESINEAEAGMNEDALLPLVDDMLRCRQEAIKKVNEMFGTNITVELNSSWEDVHERIELAEEQIEAEIEQKEELGTVEEQEENIEETEEVKEDERAEESE